MKQAAEKNKIKGEFSKVNVVSMIWKVKKIAVNQRDKPLK